VFEREPPMFCSDRLPSLTSIAKGFSTAPIGVPERVILDEVAVTSPAPVTPAAGTELAVGFDHEYTPAPLVVSVCPAEPPVGMGFFTKQFVSPGLHPGSKILLVPTSYPPLGGGVRGARAAEATKAPDMSMIRSDEKMLRDEVRIRVMNCFIGFIKMLGLEIIGIV
jgi:hypothetical protein